MSQSHAAQFQQTKSFIPNTLWMGDLEAYMDEVFIKRAFQEYGERVKSVKIILNKYSGMPQGYCFVEFEDKDGARRAMLKLNSKTIPNTQNTKRFKLNHASYGKEHLLVPEFSLFVGDLSDEVDDLKLYQAFRKYGSCHAAKVVLDQDGRSKGYGFIRFTNEMEQQRALLEMQHALLGRKPIRVSLATPKKSLARPQHYDPYNYNSYYQNQGQNYYNNWQGYNNQQYYNYQQNQTGTPTTSTTTTETIAQDAEAIAIDDLEVLEDPCEEVDITKENEAFIQDSDELYHALEDSRWSPMDCLTSVIEGAA